MANINLDIKANTQKALNEFKKLSRELDNKFLVQGLKLDVVKAAFRDITKEFDSALGQQGLRQAESAVQLQRSLALNLGTFKRFSADAAAELSKTLNSSLRSLQAEGRITEKVFKEALNISGFLEFSGSEEERKRQFVLATKDIAKFVQDTENLFGGNITGQVKAVLTGEASVESLFGLDFTSGGAAGNRLKSLLLEQRAAIESVDPAIRTQAILGAIEEFKNSPEYKQSIKVVAPLKAIFMEISGIFSPEGALGSLRVVGDELIKNFSGDLVPRNLVQVTAKLLRTLFDRESGIFAILGKQLAVVFGKADLLDVIISGVEFLTSILERFRQFLDSDAFINFLNFFKPIQETIERLFSGGGFDLSNIKATDINEFVSLIFESIRSLIAKVGEFIQGVDAAQVGSVLGNILSEIGKSIGPLIGVAFEVVKKAFVAIGSSGPGGIALGAGFAALGVGDIATNLLTRREGGLLGATGRQVRKFAGPRVRGRVSRVGSGAKRGLGRTLSRIPGSGIAQMFGSGALKFLFGQAAPQPDYTRGDPDTANKGGFTGWQGEVIRKFNQIIIIMRDSVPVYFKDSAFAASKRGIRLPGGERGRIGEELYNPETYGPMSRRDYERQDKVGRDQQAADLRRRRKFRDLRRGTGRGFMGAMSRIGRGTRGFGRGIGGFGATALAFALGDDPVMAQMASDYEFAGTNYMAPIGPLPLGSSEPYAENMAGGYDPRMISEPIPAMRDFEAYRRLDRRRAYRRSFRGRMGQLGRRAGRLGRGLGRLGGPLVGGLVTAVSLASLFGGSANASEMDGMDEEDRRAQRRERDRAVIGGLAGMAGGAAGGALLGSAFGPVGTVIGGAIGAFVGEEAVKALSDPIIDGIGDFARSIGNWFGGLWEGTKNLFGKAGQGIANFFGEKGPIQGTWRFLMDIPNKIKEVLVGGWNNVTGILSNLPKSVIAAAFGPLGILAAPLIDALGIGKALGGAGRGLTLVGENGPEMVDLGSGSVVYPMTSFIGAGRPGQASMPIVNNVTININAPGAELFADELTDAVVSKLDEMYEGQRSLNIKTT